MKEVLRHALLSPNNIFYYSYSAAWSTDKMPSLRIKKQFGNLFYRVKELQEKVKALESAHAAVEISSPDSPPAPIAAEAGEQTLPTPSATQEFHEIHGIQWRSELYCRIRI